MAARYSGSDIMTTRSSPRAPTEQMIPNENGDAGGDNSAPFTESSYPVSLAAYASESPQNSVHMIEQSCSASGHSFSDGESPAFPDSQPAAIEPPITTSSLSQLDLEQLCNNLLLRHDLNFDPNIQYKPTTDGEIGNSRLAEASRYWRGMRSELMRWFTDQDYLPTCNSARKSSTTVHRPLHLQKRHYPAKLIRLPKMFETMRQILRSLVPQEEWSMIDSRLDVDLLVQEMEYKAVDFADLSVWLRNLLRRYCSPERHDSINIMSSTILAGVYNKDVGTISSGLMQVFGILEVVKLDCANHNIRSLRFAMIDSTVEFEQKDFLDRISHGWDVTPARTWFTRQRREPRRNSGLHTLAASVADLIVGKANVLPPTLTLDYVRMRTLQLRFENLMYQAACRWTLEELVELRSQRSIPPQSYDDLFSRIAIITSDEESRSQPSRQTENVTLEIVREAYRVSGLHRLPMPQDLESTESNLLHASDPSTSVSNQLRRYLAEDLNELIEEELQAIKDLTPVQIATRYILNGTPDMQRVTERAELRSMAQRIAHISVLHWRVWGPIMYDLPEESHSS
ncbi:Protein SOSEKI 1 [Lecanora helva]